MIVLGNVGSNLFGWRLSVDFDCAAELADRISKGENGQLHQQLLDMCIPYFVGVKTRFGFHRISYRDIVEELAADAITDTIFALGDRKLAFGVRLQNAFRKCCRQRYRCMRRPTSEELAKRCDLPYVPGITGSRPAADGGVEPNEWIELVHQELQNHTKPSKTAIYERMRGSSYEEIAVILGKTAHRSRALFWGNVKQIRKNDALIRYMKDEDR